MANQTDCFRSWILNTTLNSLIISLIFGSSVFRVFKGTFVLNSQGREHTCRVFVLFGCSGIECSIHYKELYFSWLYLLLYLNNALEKNAVC